MTVKNIVIMISEAKYQDLKRLENLVQSDKIKNNGRIVVSCNVEFDIDVLKQNISEIFNINKSLILLKYTS